MANTYLNEPLLSATAKASSPATFFREVYRRFQGAEHNAGGPVNRFFKIGGYKIRLRFAGPRLVQFIVPALEHLQVGPSQAPDVTVCLWDSASTSTKLPPCPWSRDDYLARAEVRGYNNNRINISFHLGTCVLSMLDVEHDLAIFWVHDARQAPYSESAAPLRTILYWWMRRRARQLVHAAAVGTSKGSVLIPGKSGSGKSTSALACLRSNFLFLGDDHVLISKRPVPYVYSLYSSAKLIADHTQKFLHPFPMFDNCDKAYADKTLIFVHKHHSERIAASSPISAILVPCITGLHETKLKTASSATALRALAPSTIFQLSGAGPKDFRDIADIVKRVPCYTLELGTDLSEVPVVIKRLLSER